MKRWQGAIGLVLCLSAVQQGGDPNSDVSPLMADVGLLGIVVFLVLLIKGPGKTKRKVTYPPAGEEEGGREAGE